MEIQDRSGRGGIELAAAADDFIAKVAALPEVGRALPTTSYGVPQIRLDIDRAKAEQLGVKLETLFDALGTYIGSSFVNLFNQFGFVYQVYVQGEASARRTIEDISALTVPNARGEPVLIGSLVSPRFVTGPTAVLSYNTYPAMEVAVDTAERASSGAAMAAIDRLAAENLPRDYAVEWTEVAYQERIAGGYAPLIFAFGVLMIFLFLAGQYESLRLPFVVILVTPLAVFGAVGALALRDLPLDIFGQIGLLLLVGLAAKNSILLVSFAKELREQGQDALSAAKEAVRLRMRPILMTSFAFVLGCVPLAIASGAGANARISMGTVVIGGLLVATILTLFVTPVFYVGVERLQAAMGRKAPGPEPSASRGEASDAGRQPAGVSGRWSGAPRARAAPPEVGRRRRDYAASRARAPTLGRRCGGGGSVSGMANRTSSTASSPAPARATNAAPVPSQPAITPAAAVLTVAPMPVARPNTPMHRLNRLVPRVRSAAISGSSTPSAAAPTPSSACTATSASRVGHRQRQQQPARRQGAEPEQQRGARPRPSARRPTQGEIAAPTNWGGRERRTGPEPAAKPRAAQRGQRLGAAFLQGNRALRERPSRCGPGRPEQRPCSTGFHRSLRSAEPETPINKSAAESFPGRDAPFRPRGRPLLLGAFLQPGRFRVAGPPG